MKPYLFLLTLFLLTACDSSDDETRGKFESSATIEMHPSATSAENKHFVRNQLATLQTSHILEATAKELQMEPEALEKSLEISQLRENDFIKITAHHDDETLPKLIVTTLLDRYSQFRKNQERDSAKHSLAVLSEEIAKQEEEVLNARRNIAGQAYAIPYFDSPSLQKTDEEMLKSAKEKLALFEEQASETRTQIQQLESLEGEELLLYASSLDLPQNEVTHHLDQHKDAVGDRQRLIDGGLDLTHPDVAAFDEKMSKSLHKAGEECRTLLAILKTKKELVDRQVEKMKDMLADRGTENQNLNLRQQSYQRAKDEYEDVRMILRALKVRQKQARAFFEGPETLFTIHEWEHW